MFTSQLMIRRAGRFLSTKPMIDYFQLATDFNIPPEKHGAFYLDRFKQELARKDAELKTVQAEMDLKRVQDLAAKDTELAGMDLKRVQDLAAKDTELAGKDTELATKELNRVQDLAAKDTELATKDTELQIVKVKLLNSEKELLQTQGRMNARSVFELYLLQIHYDEGDGKKAKFNATHTINLIDSHVKASRNETSGMISCTIAASINSILCLFR